MNIGAARARCHAGAGQLDRRVRQHLSLKHAALREKATEEMNGYLLQGAALCILGILIDSTFFSSAERRP